MASPNENMGDEMSNVASEAFVYMVILYNVEFAYELIVNTCIVVVNIDSLNIGTPINVHEVKKVPLGIFSSTSSLIIYSGEPTQYNKL